MPHRRQIIAFAMAGLVACLALCASAQNTAPSKAFSPTSMPSMSDLQESFDARRYNDVIKQIAPLLLLKDDAPGAYDRTALLAIKAESQLQLRQTSLAADTFAQLAKELTAKNASNESIAGFSTLSLLARRSPGGKYSPKQPTTAPLTAGDRGNPRAPIDILPEDSRKTALLALFNDENRALSSRVESALRQAALPSLLGVIKAVGDVSSLELAATGAEAESKRTLDRLRQHSLTLLSGALKTMSTQVTTIEKSANTSKTSVMRSTGGAETRQTVKRGLYADDTASLKEISNSCGQIYQACDEFAKAMPGGADAYSAVREDAAMLTRRAMDLAQADFSPTRNSEPTVKRGKTN
jgi:hypothetical protein